MVKDNIEARNAANKVLDEKAWNRVLSRDAKIGEKSAPRAVTNAMKLKSEFGIEVIKK